MRRNSAELQRLRTEILYTVDALAKTLQPAIKQIQDCVGLIPAVFWGGNSNE